MKLALAKAIVDYDASLGFEGYGTPDSADDEVIVPGDLWAKIVAAAMAEGIDAHLLKRAAKEVKP